MGRWQVAWVLEWIVGHGQRARDCVDKARVTAAASEEETDAHKAGGDSNSDDEENACDYAAVGKEPIQAALALRLTITGDWKLVTHP